MTQPPEPQTDHAIVAAVLAAFGLGPLRAVWPIGGTASPKWGAETADGRWVVRVRPAEFAGDSSVGFDHHVLRRLRAAGFPVPDPQARPDGATALEIDGRVYEVLRFVAGDPFREGDLAALAGLGRFLARWHTTLAHDFPPPKPCPLREDHPQLMEPYLAALRGLANDDATRRQLDEIGRQLDRVRRELDSGLYQRLPQAIIHGDVHPGNLRFRGAEVAAVYDFDYLSAQARVRDLVDGLMSFASRRDRPLDCDDIRSLTQPVRPELDRCRALLAGYQSLTAIEPGEWEAMPLVIRSRWIQERLRGARKVPPREKIGFVLDRFFEVLDWLDRRSPSFFQELRQS